MSVDYNFEQSEVVVTFKNEQEMKERISAFEKECEEYTDDGIYCPAYVYQNDEDKKQLKGTVHLDSSGGADVDEIANLICKHFPNANGSIGYSFAEESAGGYVRCAGGGEVYIKDGKVLLPELKQVEELKKDLDMALEYITMVISNGDITECGVAHLFKKYWPEEWADAVKEKLQEVK